MSSTWGNRLKIAIFGQSHGAVVGMVLDGVPAGLAVDFAILDGFLRRRAPGQSALASGRKERDEPEFLSGFASGKTCGAPIAAIIRNHDARPADYAAFKDIPRPGHADFTAHVKHRGFQDTAGGGHHSGRLTAALCIAGGLCLQFLSEQNIIIKAEIQDLDILMEKIKFAKLRGDSVGGIIECTASGLPAGLGAPIFDGMESRLSQMIFAIPAVRGIEFGAGFNAAKMRGSTHNDAFYFDEQGQVKTRTNHHGGVLGGITSGMPLVFRVAFKPTPSIALEQESVDLSTGKPAKIAVCGRHDPCVVPRAVPCVEAAAALVLYDAILEGV